MLLRMVMQYVHHLSMLLLARNCARLAVITGVTNFLMFLSKIVVVGLCAALSYILFSGQIKVVLLLAGCCFLHMFLHLAYRLFLVVYGPLSNA